MTRTLTENAKKFLAQRPTLMGTLAGYRFYEHPVHGDEYPLIMITPEGKKQRSDFYEMPSIEEFFSDSDFSVPLAGQYSAENINNGGLI